MCIVYRCSLLCTGGIEIISSVIMKHPSDSSVALRICNIVVSLCSSSVVAASGTNVSAAEVATSTRLKLCSGGILCDALISILSIRSQKQSADIGGIASGNDDAAVVIIAVLEAINAIINGDSQRAKLFADISVPLCDAIRNNNDSIEVFVAACQTVANLSDNNPANVQKLLQAGIVNVFVEALAIHQQNPGH